MRFDAAILEEHLQIGQHALANALNFEQLFRFRDQVGHLLRQRLDGFGGIAVRTHAKRVLPVDLQQIGSFVEKSGDGFVVHIRYEEFPPRREDPSLTQNLKRKPNRRL